MSALALASLSGSGFELVRPVGVLLRGLLVLAHGLAKLGVPAAKTSSEPEITTQRTSGSGSSRSSSETISSIISGESALRASGRLMRSRVTPPWRELSTSSAKGYSATIGVIALIPVAARPMIIFWICEVPS